MYLHPSLGSMMRKTSCSESHKSLLDGLMSTTPDAPSSHGHCGSQNRE
ncbi:hypothetical protein RBSWK_05527 [Rhodopirellula baltica SWK14]|uniref:Uncharacterized protein n=1 Tax=Rhodopirellula baltica SWK14 TaxID=993516 RepID=L7C9U2_RHOBT|nr:hypothetical protein RBSWK_05527 [Rhodopirellula baltica SWK14]